jgi:hypothetical protein
MSPARSYPGPAPRISSLTWYFFAEREGFEPPGRLHDRLLSRQLQSTGLCHRSQPDRRRQGDRPAPVQALLSSTPTRCGKDIQLAASAAWPNPAEVPGA